MIRADRFSLFTVLSLVILVVLVLAIELPRRHGQRVHGEELCALRTLGSIHEVEMDHLRAGGDAARFAFLQELDAVALTRVRQGVEASDRVRFDGDDLVRDGYRFRVYLPNADGHGVGYAKREQVHDRRARAHFACYAWPVSFGDTGRRTFLLTADGILLATENQRRRYGGLEHAPRPGAGFMAADPGSVVDPPAVKIGQDRGRGIDGQFWVRAGGHRGSGTAGRE